MSIRADAHKPDFHRAAPPQLPVRVATTANITISTALNNGDTLDGITLATGDRVLVKNQTTGSENGIYIVGASPARAFDFAEGLAAYGAIINVVVGTANASTLWRCTNTTVPTIGSTALTFAQITSSSGSVASDTIWDAKGDLAAGTGADTAQRLAVGSDGQVLTADSTQTTGLKWAAASGSSTDETIPAGGTLYDGTSTSGWTSFGSPDTFDANSTVPGAFYVSKTTMGTNNLVGAYRAVGSFPKTYTMRLKDSLMHADFHGVNILFGEASPGKYWSFGPNYDGGYRYFQRQAWTTAAASGANVVYPTTARDVAAGPGLWLRIVINSSTDVELWHSYNGFLYYRYAAAQNPSFTIGVFGFGMFTFSAITMRIAIDWIHES